MLDLENLFSACPYDLSKVDKEALLCRHLNALNHYHRQHCRPFDSIVSSLFRRSDGEIGSVKESPFLPVRLFKEFDLATSAEDKVYKTLISSGTTSQKVSRIYIDRQTSAYQTKALASVVKAFLGSKRLPMLILDIEAIIKNRSLFSARGGGVLGMSNFGRDHLYVFDEKMELKEQELHRFLEKHGDGEIFLFGFTFMVWQHLLKPLRATGRRISLPRGILIHSGGWKKLAAESVDNEAFKEIVRETTGISKVHNFYGMVEQLGSIFMECEHGHFHSSQYGDVLVRDPADWSVQQHGRQGIVQVISILPHSYPGHSLLTEDIGTIHGEDDCPCGRKGKHFTIAGRIPQAEVRGCSDTYERQ